MFEDKDTDTETENVKILISCDSVIMYGQGWAPILVLGAIKDIRSWNRF